jgi:hypothetical protein
MDYLKELDIFNRVKLEPIEHKYLLDGKDVDFKSVSYLKNKYKKKVDWDIIKKAIAKRDKTSVDEITKEWDHKMKVGTTRGTYIHEYIEFALDEKPLPNFVPYILSLTPTQLKEYAESVVVLEKLANQYIKDFKLNHTLIKSELKMFDLDYMIAGTLDKLFLKYGIHLAIRDYKCDKQFRTPNEPFKYKKKLTGPLSHLVECELVIYSLQQCLYKIILEKNTNLIIPIENIELVWFNQKLEEPKIFPILDLTAEAEEILKLHKHELDTTTNGKQTKNFIPSFEF